MTEHINLSVSGKKFRLTREAAERSGLFASLLSDCENHGTIYIDRSPTVFKHVQGFLIDHNYPYPKKFHEELKYYQIEHEPNQLYDPHNDTVMKIGGIFGGIFGVGLAFIGSSYKSIYNRGYNNGLYGRV